MEVLNNKKLFRFEILFEGGKIAFLEYRWKKGDMLLMRTYVPDAWRRKGIGTKLVKAVLEYADKQGLGVQVYCPFASLFINRKQ